MLESPRLCPTESKQRLPEITRCSPGGRGVGIGEEGEKNKSVKNVLMVFSHLKLFPKFYVTVCAASDNEICPWGCHNMCDGVAMHVTPLIHSSAWQRLHVDRLKLKYCS